MKNFEGYLKQKLGNDYVLLAGGGHKTVDDFLLKSGGQMTGPLTWKDSTALPQRTSVQFLLTLDTFASGGTTGWASLDTLKSSIGLGNYVTLDTAQTITGNKTFSGTNDFMLTINRNHGSATWVTFSSNGTILGGLGITNNHNVVFSDKSSVYTIWHSGNFTPSNYLPLTGGTMTGNITMDTNHYIYGVNESYGSMLHFDGNRTVIGSVGSTSTLATHLRSKTGHLTCGTDNTASYTVWDSGNDGTNSGLDADLLDGLHASDFPILSRNGTAFKSGGTCDVTEYGTYYAHSKSIAASLTNTPYTGSNFKLYHLATGQDAYPVQIAIAYSNVVYFRGNNNGTWGDWRRFAFTNSNITGTAANVTGTVEITHGGTGATTRLDALKALTNENVSTDAEYFLTITSQWSKGGYTSVTDAKTILAMTGATDTTAGTAGVVPAPPSDGYDTKFLGADGTWKIPDYPTKNSWNYDDCYVSSLAINNDYLRWTKNGATNDLTIPYATKAASDSKGRSLVTYKEYSGTFPPNDGTQQWYTLLTYTNTTFTKSAIIEINTRRGTATILIQFFITNTPFITFLGYYGSPSTSGGGFTGGVRVIADENNAKIQFQFQASTLTGAYRQLGVKVYSEIPEKWTLVDSLVADTNTYDSFLADVKATSKCLTGGGLMPTANNTYNIGSDTFKYENVYATTFHGALQGNANTATKLATERDISLIGDATGSATFDGSADVSISVSINDMTGATVSEAGTAGFVPAPPSDGYNTKFLRADGIWSVPAASIENAASATKLQTKRTLWGQEFDGTANVSGNMTGVGTISASGNNTITKTSGDAIFAAVNNNGSVELLASTNRGVYDRTNTKWLIGTNGTNTWLSCGNVAIASSANTTYKLYVNGTVGVTGATTLSSTLSVSSLLTASGGVTIPSGKNLKIGDAQFYWDSTSQGIKITKPLSDYNPTNNFKTINGNSIIGTGDITIEGGGATKLHTSHQLTRRDQWFRFANLTVYGASYLVSIRDNYYNDVPTPVTWIINVGYDSVTVTQVGRAVLSPTSLTKLRTVRYDNNGNYGFHLEVYTPYQTYISQNTPEINIMNLGRDNMTDGIELVHDPDYNTKWLEVNSNIQSNELLIEEVSISDTTTLWGQPFNGTSNVSGSLLGVTSIEMNSDGALSNFGGFIDFHYNGSSADYTSRIIEDANGRIAINSVLYAQYGGNVGIGTTPSSSYKLYVNGNTTATNFYTTSDRNKKKNISEFSEHIRKFQLKDTEKWNYGVIAQEVEEMFREGEDGNMTVNYDSILSYYIGQLENKVKVLEEKIRILETRQNKDV